MAEYSDAVLIWFLFAAQESCDSDRPGRHYGSGLVTPSLYGGLRWWPQYYVTKLSPSSTPNYIDSLLKFFLVLSS